MARPPGTAVCYLRDSQGESDQSPVQYIPWVVDGTARLGLTFRGDEATALAMARGGESCRGDLYLDYGVPGNLLSRPGFDAMRQRVLADHAVSHVYVPRRDRLARPDNPLDALAIEYELRRAGATIVMLDRALPPIAPGGRDGLEHALLGLIEYDTSGRFRRDLAQKLVLAKVKLAEGGHSIGGNPPYGFRRWLVSADGEARRELQPGERVKMAGHHVAWLPTAADEIAVTRRILDAIEATPAGRIARQLNDEGVPSPGGGRQGQSGLWTPGTVKRVATHPLLAAVLEYGRRGMGDQQRLTPAGPRDLTAADFGPDGRPRTVNNPDAGVIRVHAAFEPVVGPERRARILATVEERGRHLKGKPRSRDGVPNPLGGRVYDAGCGWPMYRNAKRGQFRYSCGLYMNSDAKRCSHNMVPGEAATRFVLGAIRQRVLPPALRAKLEARLRAMAEAEAGRDVAGEARIAAEKTLADARRKRDTVGGNMALAASTEQFTFLSAAFDRASAEVKALEGRLGELPPPRGATDVDREVRAALAGLDRLQELAGRADAAAELVSAVDAKLYLSFRPEGDGVRRRHVPSGGVLTFGLVAPPVEIYSGPTDKAIVRRRMASGEPVQATPASGSRGSRESQTEADRSGNAPRVTGRGT